jgi:hypothetical protein
MDLNKINAISWQDDGVSVPFDSFYNFTLRVGFKFIFTSPIGSVPNAAIAAKTIEELIKQISGIRGFDIKYIKMYQ